MNLAYLLVHLNIIKRAYHAAQNRPVDSSILHQEREPELGRLIKCIAWTSYAILSVIALPLFFWQEVFLPPFFVELAYWLKMEVFFERYLHLIREGGLAFADRLFIAQAIILTINVILVPPYTIAMAILVRRYMAPIRHITKGMKWQLMAVILGFGLIAYITIGFGRGLDQNGFHRAVDGWVSIYYPIAAILAPPTTTALSAVIFKWIYVLFDGWREGRLRALFQTAPPPQGEI